MNSNILAMKMPFEDFPRNLLFFLKIFFFIISKKKAKFQCLLRQYFVEAKIQAWNVV
jgi:hypothetical protein